MASIRDLTCIHSVAHMAEYGKYEEEFIVYGCAAMENGKIVYRITPLYEEIMQFQAEALLQNQCLTPIHTLMNRCIVQTGQRDGLLYETEIKLANTLRQLYSRTFFTQLQHCNAIMANDAAKPIFDQLQANLNGIFSMEYLQLFEGLVAVAYQAKVLTEESLQDIQKWLRRVKNQMEYDVVIKKPFTRTFYGFCYLDATGRPMYKINAEQFTVVSEQRKCKQKQLCTTPVFQKTYWYDYGVEPKTIRAQFKEELQQYYGENYWSYWKQIKALPAVVSQQQFENSLKLLEQEDSQEAVHAFLEYGYDWNLYQLSL